MYPTPYFIGFGSVPIEAGGTGVLSGLVTKATALTVEGHGPDGLNGTYVLESATLDGRERLSYENKMTP